MWKGLVVTVTIKHKYFFIIILHYKNRQNTIRKNNKILCVVEIFSSSKGLSSWINMVRIGSVI